MNHMHSYPVIPLFPLFLDSFMGKVSLLCATSLFIMESVNYFGKTAVQIGKCIIVVLIELN